MLLSIERIARRPAVAVRMLATAAIVWGGWASVPAFAQLEITEIMFNPLNENAWEWIEIRNNGPQIDLNGYFADRLGDRQIPVTGSPNISNTVAENTIIPAGGVAVFYDGFFNSGNPNNFVDQNFRDAWGLAPSVPVVSVSFWPELVNGGTAFGFWPSYAAYELDLVLNSETGFNEVAGFANAAFSIDYRTDFPAVDGMGSVQWNGSGSNQNGLNWTLSQPGVDGAVTSVQVIDAGASINDVRDIGNPGILPSGTAPAGLHITEVMYNPRSAVGNNEWEWIEIFNSTGAAIDFATTNYVFDDLAGANLDAPNVTTGNLPHSSAAILFNADVVSLENFQAAWDPGGANGLNLIPVTDWSAMNNGGDTIGLWSSFGDYTSETTEGGRTFGNAEVSLAYDDGEDALGNFWPADNGNGSIYLSDFASDPANGNSWFLSGPSDGISFNASAVEGGQLIHAGGDVGSPGTFAPSAPSLPGDFDGDGDVDDADFAVWEAAFPTGLSGADLLVWQAQFGQGVTAAAATGAVPEPTMAALALLAGLTLGSSRRRRA